MKEIDDEGNHRKSVIFQPESSLAGVQCLPHIGFHTTAIPKNRKIQNLGVSDLSQIFIRLYVNRIR
jgi:hypothetical protein